MKDGRKEWKLYCNNKLIALESTPRAAIGKMIADSIGDLTYMSYDGLYQLMNNALGMLAEAGERALAERYAKSFKRIDNEQDAEKKSNWLMSFIVDTFLSSEGLGTLTGFGMGTFEKTEQCTLRRKSTIFCNPEQQSIYGVY